MMTNAYENALRGSSKHQPMRNDSLGGIDSPLFFGPATLLALGVGTLAYMRGGINFNDTTVMTGGAFLAGWLLGGGTAQFS